MKIGAVIHGPEVIDSGQAEKVLEKLSCLGEVEAKLGGTMGKTAVLDAGLEGRIDIRNHQKPSACIESFFENSDLVCLINQGKTPETGKTFGKIVFSHLREPDKKPLFQIEYSGTSETDCQKSGCQKTDCQGGSCGKLIPLNKKANVYAEKLSVNLGIPAETIHLSRQQIDSIRTEKCPETGKTQVFRKLSGAFPGENILVNGIVIGKANSSEVKIVSENGFIAAIEGGTIKEHGLEKLHSYEKKEPIDLENAWIKSGSVRRSAPSLRKSSKPIPCPLDLKPIPLNGAGKVVLIDHAAEHSFELADGAQLAVTVGDDTTAIAGDILYRLGIPILGITDGDCDDLADRTEIFPGSLILRLAAGNDDIVGRKLRQELFKGEITAVFEDVPALKEEVLRLAESEIEAIFEY
ncbi:DUF2117 family protein [Methanosarcina sp. Mfa9]|uniref:DUF2117 family protein n=1 Tax=Methanosarcina sp. Mfa9 TaxID=3439063 RepID=UPI003F85814B